MNEIWKDIKGFEGHYQVSNLGRVRSLKNKVHLMKLQPNNIGYQRVFLCKNGKYSKCFIHRLVADAFIPNPLKYTEVNHLDENILNNYASNLEWCTRKQNMNYGTAMKRKTLKVQKPVLQFDKNGVFLKRFESFKEAAESIGMKTSSLSSYFCHENKTLGGYVWKRLELKDMGIRMTTKLDELHRMMMKEAERVERLTIRALSYLGEQCVIRVRDRSGDRSWYDQSGNLRSSVGYVIAHNGNIVSSYGFDSSMGKAAHTKQVEYVTKDGKKVSFTARVKAGGQEGAKAGKDLAEELIKRYSNDYVLVVVAGMNYAEYVEAMKNKNVLASTELWATSQVPKMLEKLKKQIAE